jgi:hypothetical protein
LLSVNVSSAAIGIISAMITPSLLILASGSLVASALMRLGRSVDRSRALVSQIEGGQMTVPRETLLRWFARYEQRGINAERAIGMFFAAVAVFVSDCLSIALDRAFHGEVAWLPVSLTIVGMILLLIGASFMVLESRLGGAQIREEIARGRSLLA